MQTIKGNQIIPIKKFKYTPPFSNVPLDYIEFKVKYEPTKIKNKVLYPTHKYDILASKFKNHLRTALEPVNDPDYNYYADKKAYYIYKNKQFDKKLAHDKSPIIHSKDEFVKWLRRF